jgi:hypothetical protein
MKLLDVLKKYVIPSVLTTISIDSYRRQVVGHSPFALDLAKATLVRGLFLLPLIAKAKVKVPRREIK